MDLLNFAHRYLRTVYNSPTLHYPTSQLTVSLACVLYLISGLDLVDPQVSNEETRSQVVQCFHDLQLYANDHWLDHLSALANSPTDIITDGPLMRRLSQGLEQLTERHSELVIAKSWNAQDEGDSLPLTIEEGWHRLGFSAPTQSLLNRVIAYKSTLTKGDRTANSSCVYKKMLFSSNICDADCSLISGPQWSR